MRLSGKGVARKIAKLYRVLANWFGKQIPKKMELGAISLLEGVRPPHGVGWKTRLTAGPHQSVREKGWAQSSYTEKEGERERAQGWAKLLRVGPGEGKWAEGRGFGACGRNRERRAGPSGQKQWGRFPFSFLLFSFCFFF